MSSNEHTINELYAEIEAIKKENISLKKSCYEFEQIFKQYFEIMENYENNISLLKKNVIINRNRIDSLPFELADPDYKLPFFKPHILSIAETRSKIIDEKKSIGRFGDGEFGIIEGLKRWNFQETSEKLAEKLKKVLNSEEEGFIVGLNGWFYSNLSPLRQESADGVRAFMTPERRSLHSGWLKENHIYGDANVHRISSDNDVEDLKRLWDKKDIVIIEGQYTRMGIGNHLLDNCNSIERIIAPAENAIERYDDIMSEALKLDKSKTILLALGPTATALAYDLYLEGYHAVDIGHLDLIYEEYLRGLNEIGEVFIPYKYCTADEQPGFKREIEEIKDEKYESQIVSRIC